MNFHDSLSASLIGTAAIVLTQSSPVVAQFANEQALSAAAKSFTVVINGQNPGSGVIIGKDGNTYTVLTAKHVVPRQDEYEIVTPDAQQHRLDYSTVRKFPNIDLATLEFTSSQTYAVAEIGDSDAVTEGDFVYISGWPHPGQAITQRVFQLTGGSVSGRALGAAEDGYELVYTNITRSGMSGGPVLNNNGDVVGIHGRAEGEAIYNPDTGDTVAVKSGFNLGIPLKLLIEGSTVAELPKNPSFATPITWWGIKALQQNNFSEAVTHLDKALAIDGKSWIGLVAMGQTQYEMGNFDQAIRFFEQAVELEGEEVILTVPTAKDGTPLTPKIGLAAALYQKGDRRRSLPLASEIMSLQTAEMMELLTSGIWGNQLLQDSQKLLSAFFPSTILEISSDIGITTTFVFSPDGTSFAFPPDDDETVVEIWDIATGQKKFSLSGHTDEVKDLAFNSEGTQLATINRDEIKIWDLGTGGEITTLANSSGGDTIAFSSQNILAMGGGKQNEVELFNIQTGQLLKTLSGSGGYIQPLVFSPNGQLLAGGNVEGTFHLWDMNTGQTLHTLQAHDSGWLFDLTFSPDGQTLISSGSGEQVKLWNVRTGEEIRTITTELPSSFSNFSVDGQTIAGNSIIGTTLWNPSTGDIKMFFPLVTGILEKGMITPQGNQFVGWFDDTVYVWQLP